VVTGGIARNRASSKYIAKRVTEEDHLALTKYAEDHGVEIAELLTPFVHDLIQRADEHCGQPQAYPTSVKASQTFCRKRRNLLRCCA
jgi:hypothetical protein